MHRRRLDQNFHAKNRNEKSIKGSHTKAEKPGIVNPKPHTQLKPLDLDLKSHMFPGTLREEDEEDFDDLGTKLRSTVCA